MTCTDASAHVQGDGAKIGIFKPNNYDGILDGDPPGSGEDYPEPSLFKAALISNGINPLFGAIQTSGVLEFYKTFSENLGIGSFVPVSPSSGAEVVQAILNATLTVLSKAIMAIQSDSMDRIYSIEYNGTYPYAVKALEEVTFTVYMEAELTETQYFGLTGSSTVRYVGFGDTATIVSYTKVECTGCSLNSNTAQVDICGTCGGNGSSCLGCDGLPYIPPLPTLKFDICGVCGGNNESCLDCLGQPIPPGGNGTAYDVCGVCGGDNSTCLGCDGIPNSGLVYSNCNPRVCGGPPCSNFTAAIVALASIAVVGIVAAIIAVILLCGAGAAMATADAELIEKETNLHDNPLYEEAKRKFDNPLWQADAGAN